MATEKVTIPDFGDVQEITVVEIYVSPGDSISEDDELIALESEKAVMDIPSPAAGIVKEIYLKEDDSVKSGDVILLLELEGDTAATEQTGQNASAPEEEPSSPVKEETSQQDEKQERAESPREPSQESETIETDGSVYHATPSVRSYARELGVGLDQLKGSGPKGRILKEDVQQFVKGLVKGGASATPGSPVTMEAVPLEDFSKYGEVEEVPLGRIKKVSGPHLHRSWVTIPHVTQFDEADVTDLEQFRKQMNDEAGKDGVRFSPLVFIIKAVVATLKEFPIFNASLNSADGSLILKHFYNIGIAVDTPNGLVVPVIKDADKKGMKETASELKDLSQAARDSKLAINDMQGASFTISSLGGIGGTGFTPIVNAPQVAILGLSRNYMKPVWDEELETFLPRLTLPFSLSYDHRVIDGADAARFCRALSRSIEDLRRALL